MSRTYVSLIKSLSITILPLGRLARYVTVVAAGIACAKGVNAAGFVDIQSVGLPVSVQAVRVDREGFLWTAGAHGVCRFDGADWFCPEERAARTLYVDDDNGIWAGLDDKSVIAILPRGRVVRMFGQASGAINDVAHTSGTLWLATETGLYTAPTNATSPTFKQVLSEPVTKLVIPTEGQVVAAVGRRVLSIKPQAPAVALATLDSTVSAMILTRDLNAFVVGTAAGTLHRIKNGQSFTLPMRNDHSSIISLCEDGAKHIWVGTDGRLHRFDPNSESTDDFNDAPGLPHNQVNAIAIDGTARLWLGTPAGLAQMRLAHPLRSFTRSQGLLTEVTFAVTGSRDGTIWTATGPGVAGWRNGWAHTLGPMQGLMAYDSRTVAVDGEDKLWIGGWATGLYAVEGGKAVKKWPVNGNMQRGVRSLRPRRSGGLWVGLDAGGLGRFVDGKFTWEFEPRSTGRDLVFDVAQNAEGKGVWLALSHDGLALWRDGQLKRFGVAEGLPPAEVLSLATTDGGRVLWVGTNGAGLIRFDGQRFARIGASAGLFDDQIFGLATDDSRLWMSSPLAIGAAALSELNSVADGKQATLVSEVFGMADGVPGEPIRGYPPSAFRSNDGTIWFPTMRGLVNLDPKALGSAESPRPISFDDVQVNGHSILNGSHAQHPSLRAELMFKFTSPQFSVSRQLGFRYKLEGLEAPGDVWHTVQQGREARYENVPPGAYRFVVQKIAHGSIPLVQASFPLRLPKPWHATWLFRGCVGGLVLVVLFIADRRRVRQIEQTHEVVLSERARIARDIHDTLEQDLLGLRLQVDAAALTMSANPGSVPNSTLQVPAISSQTAWWTYATQSGASSRRM